MNESDSDSEGLSIDSYDKDAEGIIDSVMAVYKRNAGENLVLVTWCGVNEHNESWEPSWQSWNDLPQFEKSSARKILLTKSGGDVYTEKSPPALALKALVGFPDYLNHRREWKAEQSRAGKEPVKKRSRAHEKPETVGNFVVDDEVVIFNDSEMEMEHASNVIEMEKFQAEDLEVNFDDDNVLLSMVPQTAVAREVLALTLYSTAVAEDLNGQKALKEAITGKMVLEFGKSQDKIDRSYISVEIKEECVKGICLVCRSDFIVVKRADVALQDIDGITFDLKSFRRHIRSEKCFNRETGEAKTSGIVEDRSSKRLLLSNQAVLDVQEAKSIVAESFGPWLFKSNPRRFKSPAYRATFLSLALRILELIFENSTMVSSLCTRSFAAGLKRLMLFPSNPLQDWIKCLSQFISRLNSLSRFRRFIMGPIENMVTSSTSSSYRIIAYEFLVYLCISEREVVPDIELLLNQWQQSNRIASGSQKRHEGFLRAVVAQQQRLENLNLFATVWDQMILYSDFAAKLLRLCVINGSEYVCKVICENANLEYCLQIAAVLGIFVSVQGSRKQIFANLVFIMEADLVDIDSPLIQSHILEKLGNQFVSGIVFKGEMSHMLICEDKVGKLSQPSGVRMLYWAAFSLKMLQLLTLYRYNEGHVKIKHSQRIEMFLENHLFPVFVRKNYRKENELLQIKDGKEFLKMIEYGLEYSPPFLKDGIWQESFIDENKVSNNSSFSGLETFRKLRRVTVEVSSLLFDGDLELLNDHALLTRHSFETVNVHYHSLLRFNTTVQAGMRVSHACFGTTEEHYPERVISDQQRLLQERLVRQKPPPSPENILALRISCLDGRIQVDLKTAKKNCSDQLKKIIDGGGFSDTHEYSLCFPSALGSLSSSFIVLDSSFAGMLKCSCCAQPLFQHKAKIEKNDQNFRITVASGSVEFKCATERASSFLNDFVEINLLCCGNFSTHQQLLPATTECSCAKNWSFVTSQKIKGTFRSLKQFKEQILLL